MWYLNTTDESEPPSHAGSPKKYVVLHYPDGRLCFLLTNSGCFWLSAAFSWSNMSSTCWNWFFGFPEESHNRGLLSNPTIHTSLDEDWPLVVVVHFAHPTISSILCYCIASTVHQNLFLKTVFSLHFSRELHAQVWSSFFFFFFCLTYVELKHQSD